MSNDERIEAVRLYAGALLSDRADARPILALGRGAGRAADTETLRRWINARRSMRVREEVSGRELPEAREHCSRIAAELALRLAIPVEAMERILIAAHDRDPEPGDGDAENVGPLLDIEQVADRLKISAATVRRLIVDGVLPKPLKLRRLTRWPKATIERWLKQVAK